MIVSALRQFFSPDPRQDQAREAYLQIVTQARQLFFYRDWQVEDSIDGRFDIITLHLFLILSRCESDAVFCRFLMEVFFADMDRSLREMGVGDTGVGLRIKNMAQAFYGRLKTYQETIGDEASLIQALKRNVWREKPVADAAVVSLAGYLRQNRSALQSQPVEALTQSHITFLR